MNKFITTTGRGRVSEITTGWATNEGTGDLTTGYDGCIIRDAPADV